MYAPEVTPRQKAFDLIFGVIIPALSLIFDPIVFKGNFIGTQPPLWRFGLSAYFAIGIGTVTLTIWLYKRPDSAFWTSFSATAFFVGSALSFLLGVVMLPYSIFGLIILIGILGFTPFVTSFVYFRNGIRAAHAAQTEAHRNTRIAATVWSLVITLVLPGVIFWQTNQFVELNKSAILDGNPNQVYQATQNLTKAFWCAEFCYQDLILSYRNADPSRQQLLKDSFFEITGGDIEEWLWTHSD
jgi:hypothetical protein